jgi:hypothetical protein
MLPIQLVTRDVFPRARGLESADENSATCRAGLCLNVLCTHPHGVVFRHGQNFVCIQLGPCVSQNVCTYILITCDYITDRPKGEETWVSTDTMLIPTETAYKGLLSEERSGAQMPLGEQQFHVWVTVAWLLMHRILSFNLTCGWINSAEQMGYCKISLLFCPFFSNITRLWWPWNECKHKLGW